MKVLAVDDSPTMLDILAGTLDDAGHAVTKACNGVEALDMLQSLDVDLIISDLNMPAMNGFELLQEVRQSPSHMGTPFVFLTTETGEDLRSAARESGATAWFQKPFDPATLLSFVERFRPA